MLAAGIGGLSHDELLVSLLGSGDGGVCDEGEVDPGVGHLDGLEPIQVHVECPVKPEGSSDGGNNLGDQPVRVSPAGVVDDLIISSEGTVTPLKGGENIKIQHGLPVVVNGESFHQQAGEARADASTEIAEDEESCETSAGVCHAPDTVQDKGTISLPMV